MRGVASPAERQSLPNSLMERLALQANGRLPVPVQSARDVRPAVSPRTTLLSFGAGALAGGVIGGIALLGLQALAASDRRPSTLAEAPAAAASWHQRQVFDLAIAREERAYAPLRLHVTGGGGDDVEIILHGVPAAASLSRGQRRGAVTWVLTPADLDDVHLSLSAAAPDTFDVRIDLLAPPGVPTVGSIARVRVVDSATPAKSTTAGEAPLFDRQGDSVAAATRLIKSRSAQVGASPAFTQQEKDRGATVQGRGAAAPTAKATVAVPQAEASARPWPDGASALGAVSRDSQEWWSMQPPPWSPFQEPSGTQ